MTTLGEKLFDLEARIEGVFPLAIGDPEGPPEWFRDFCEDSDGSSKAVFERFPPLATLLEEREYPGEEEVAETIAMNGSVNGWVCRIAWCRREYITREIFQSGWGITTWQWVWGQTADEAVARALVVVSAHHDAQREEAPSAA